MKKGILIIVGLLALTTLNATDANDSYLLKEDRPVVNYNEAVTFIERGIEFYVFLNGDFDFNTRSNYNTIRNQRNRVRIDKDYNGRIRRVGNVFIHYDIRGNVKRIGNVFMRYKFGNLTKVGQLKIKYNRYGDPFFYGNVKRGRYSNHPINVDFNINLGDVCDYNDDYFYRSDFNRNYRQFSEDNDYYYYRALPNAKTGKRSKVLKRKKEGTSKRSSKKNYRRNYNTNKK